MDKTELNQIHDFPLLALEYLKKLTVGIYQLNLAASYVQDKQDRESTEVFEVEMMRDHDRIPEPGLLRVRAYFRFRNATKYQLWIAYTPVSEAERMKMMKKIRYRDIIARAFLDLAH